MSIGSRALECLGHAWARVEALFWRLVRHFRQRPTDLAAEARTNLSAGGLRLPTLERLPVFTRLSLLVRLAGAGEAAATATVVAPLPDGVALAVDGDTGALLETLRARTPAPGEEVLAEAVEDGEAPDSEARTESAWDRLRSLSRMEKLLLAAKADRVERAILAQDADPQVLYTLLKNPRLTADEVIRISKSPFLTFQTAEAIVKSNQWFSNLEVRVALDRVVGRPVEEGLAGGERVPAAPPPMTAISYIMTGAPLALR